VTQIGASRPPLAVSEMSPSPVVARVHMASTPSIIPRRAPLVATTESDAANTAARSSTTTPVSTASPCWKPGTATK
jgi:hypothetical protein